MNKKKVSQSCSYEVSSVCEEEISQSPRFQINDWTIEKLIPVQSSEKESVFDYGRIDE